MTNIYLEVGRKKVIAGALNWPGWYAIGKTEELALEGLTASTHRYKLIAQRAGLTFEPGELAIVERVTGDATTDWGAPSVAVSMDAQPVASQQAERGVALLRAAWTIFDEVVAASSQELRKGLRGGGRDRDEIVRHVVEAERMYARKIGVRSRPFAPDDREALNRQREEITAVLRQPSDGSAVIPEGWQAAYALRRIAWHVIDHIWEIEDKQI